MNCIFSVQSELESGQEYSEELEELEVFSNKLMDKIRRIDSDKKENEEQLRIKNQEEQLEDRKLSTLRTEESLLRVENIEFNNKLDTRLQLSRTLCSKHEMEASLLEEKIEAPFNASRFSDKVCLNIKTLELVSLITSFEILGKKSEEK